MFDDPIVLETQKHREEYAASFGYDLARIVADLQARQGGDGRTVVDRSSAEGTEQRNARETSAKSNLKPDSTPRSS